MNARGAGRRFATWAGCGLLAWGPVTARAGHDGPSADFRAWLAHEMAAQGIPGVSVAVVRDYHVAWAAGFGEADKAAKRAMTPGTLLQAASVSKPATAIAVLISFARHGLSLDAPVDALLATAKGPGGVSWKLPNPFHTPVTTRMLLSHTGGTPDTRYAGYRYGYDRTPPEPIDALPTLQQELDGRSPARTPAIRVVREPGPTWVYSPAGYTVLQAILSNVEGQPFERAMDALLLQPLHMSDSTFAQPMPPDVAGRVAAPYVAADEPLADGPRVFDASASGGLTTTASDLARLIIAVQLALKGEAAGPVEPALAQALLTRQGGKALPGHCLAAAEGVGRACLSSWGLGFDVNLTAVFEHAPDGAPTAGYFGHSGFNSGYLTIAMGSKSGGNGVVIMANAAPENMAGPAPQFAFMTAVVRRVALDEGWR